MIITPVIWTDTGMHSGMHTVKPSKKVLKQVGKRITSFFPV